MIVDQNYLPQSWTVARLADLVAPRRERVNPRYQSDLPFVGLENIEAHTMRLLGTIPANTMKSSAARFCAGDLLYGRLRPYLNKVTRLDFDGLCSTEFIVIPDSLHLRTAFLQYRLNAADFVRFASQQHEGDRPRVDFNDIGDFEIKVPPAREQLRIVQRIEELFCCLDAGFSSLRHAKAKLKRYRGALLKAALEGHLTAEWRKENPSSESAVGLLGRISKERWRRWEQQQLENCRSKGKTPPKKLREKYKEPAGPNVRELVDLPQRWCWATVAQLLARSEYGTSVKCGYESSGIPVIRIPNISSGYLAFSNLKFSGRPLDVKPDDLLKPRDLLLCRTNGSIGLVGKAAVVPDHLRAEYYFASYLLRLRFILPDTLPEFVHLWISSPRGRRFIESNTASSAGQHNISLSLIHRMPVPLPPVSEQQEIVERVTNTISIIDAVQLAVESNLRRANHLRQTILEQAFNGRLVPQDSSDEPASALLEQIKAHQETSGNRKVKKGQGKQACKTE